MSYDFLTLAHQFVPRFRMGTRRIPTGVVVDWRVFSPPHSHWLMTMTCPRLGLERFPTDDNRLAELYRNLAHLAEICRAQWRPAQ